MNLSVVIPAYNEAATIERVVEKLLQLPELLEIIIVDDCSTDKTAEILQRLANEHSSIKVTRHQKNSGKTEALKTEIIRNMIITSQGFGFEIEVTAKVAKLKCAIYEVPISYYGRTYEEGKKIGFIDGLEAFWLVFRFNLFCGLSSSFRQLPQRNEAWAILTTKTQRH